MEKYRLKGVPGLEYEAVQVTSENAKEVAEWCGGMLVEETDAATGAKTPGINVPCLDRNRRASVGHYVMHGTIVFDVVTPLVFERLHEKVEE